MNLIAQKKAGVRKCENGNFKFDFTQDSSEDIIYFSAYSIQKTTFKNNVYMFGYEFVENAESKDRAQFIEYLKGMGEHKISDVDLREFIEFSLSKNNFSTVTKSTVSSIQFLKGTNWLRRSYL